MLGTPLAILIAIALPEMLTRWLFLNGVIHGTITILFSLLRRDHTGLANRLIILQPWGITTDPAITAGGINAPVISLYPIESRDIMLTAALLKVVVHADADGLGMALRNIIENAFKVTRDTPVPMITIGCNANKEKFII